MTETATFGAGCFWGVEVTFRNVPGVKDAAVGYMGGSVQNPTYEQVCTGRTGHAEVVRIEFDPAEVSYEQLLDAFWSSHNPTRAGRLSFDRGQYRSAIFVHTPEQQEQALESRARVQAGSDRPVVTEVEPAGDFWHAEERHQQYLVKHGRATCLV